jgi:hypothetical protein
MKASGATSICPRSRSCSTRSNPACRSERRRAGRRIRVHLLRPCRPAKAELFARLDGGPAQMTAFDALCTTRDAAIAIARYVLPCPPARCRTSGRLAPIASMYDRCAGVFGTTARRRGVTEDRLHRADRRASPSGRARRPRMEARDVVRADLVTAAAISAASRRKRCASCTQASSLRHEDHVAAQAHLCARLARDLREHARMRPESAMSTAVLSTSRLAEAIVAGGPRVNVRNLSGASSLLQTVRPAPGPRLERLSSSMNAGEHPVASRLPMCEANLHRRKRRPSYRLVSTLHVGERENR